MSYRLDYYEVRKMEKKDMYDIGIVGGGIAGMTAAIYGLRAGKSVVLFEGTGFGGQMLLTSHIENYPGISRISGNDLAENLRGQMETLGAKIQRASVKEIVLRDREKDQEKLIVTEQGEFPCKTIILATGQTHRKLGVPGEDQFAGLGVSYCAVCDGAFFKGMNVAVVGGGSTALEDAAYLSNHCSKVYLIHRRDAFRGEDYLVERLREKANVEFVLNTIVTEIEGSFAVEKVKLHNLLTDEDGELSVEGVFIAIGQVPKNEGYAHLVDLDEAGYIIAGEDCKTSREGIFAAGDCRTKNVRQLVTAAADGALAALGATKACEK